MRESIIRCNNCEEIIFGPSHKQVERGDLNVFTILNNKFSIKIEFDKKMKIPRQSIKYNLDIDLNTKSQGAGSKDVCAACVIRAINNAIKNEVAKRLEGGENI